MSRGSIHIGIELFRSFCGVNTDRSKSITTISHRMLIARIQITWAKRSWSTSWFISILHRQRYNQKRFNCKYNSFFNSPVNVICVLIIGLNNNRKCVSFVWYEIGRKKLNEIFVEIKVFIKFLEWIPGIANDHNTKHNNNMKNIIKIPSFDINKTIYTSN